MRDFFAWESKYEVGIKHIDEQHQKLVVLINKLFNAMKTGDGANVLNEIMHDLVDYTKFHFSDEESYMEKCNYPDIVNHKKSHAKLIQDVQEYQKKLASGKVGTSVEVMSFLKDWLVNHIYGTDMKYVPYMKKIVD